MRKQYLDNIRWIAVLILFPYHAARVFDGVQPFYVKGPEMHAATAFVLSCTPWFMPVLFVVAGMSARYALQKRSKKEFIRERFTKLFIPLVSGVLLLIPVQTYYAEVFHHAYTGSYWGQYLLFFTKPTDFSGYGGGFTPGQLWFVLDLFVISLAVLPLIHWAKVKNRTWPGVNFFVIPLFLVPFVCSYFFDIGGKSLGEYCALYLLGYFVLSEASVQEFTDRYRFTLLVLAVALTWYTVAFQTSLQAGTVHRGIMIATSWICILAILGHGRHSLNFQNHWSRFLSQSSFSCYLFHQSWIVLIGFYVVQTPLPAGLQFLMIVTGGFLGSILTYAFCKRWKALRFLFGIKGTSARQTTPAETA